MIQKISVFISSTSDLKDERQAVKEAASNLRMQPFLFEDVKANSATPEDFCREFIGKSEVYVGILGGKYGSLYPPKYEGSIVEYEFNEACRRNGFCLTAVFTKVMPPEQIEPQQQNFRRRVEDFSGGVWRRTYDSIEKLKYEVSTSIAEWLADAYIKYKNAEEPLAARQHEKLKGIATALAALAVLVALLCTLLPLGMTAKSVAIAIGCLAVGIILCIVVAQYLL